MTIIPFTQVVFIYRFSNIECLSMHHVAPTNICGPAECGPGLLPGGLYVAVVDRADFDLYFLVYPNRRHSKTSCSVSRPPMIFQALGMITTTTRASSLSAILWTWKELESCMCEYWLFSYCIYLQTFFLLSYKLLLCDFWHLQISCKNSGIS